MKSLVKALLVLAVMLVPTLSASGADFDSRFVRLQRNAKQEPVALQTAITTYIPKSGDSRIKIDLVGAVHVGEKSYYEQLNKAFGQYDVVLYELVAKEGTRPEKGRAQKSGNPLSLFQVAMQQALQLEHQLEVVDYQKTTIFHRLLHPLGGQISMNEVGIQPLVGSQRSKWSSTSRSSTPQRIGSYSWLRLRTPEMVEDFGDWSGAS